ncbi:MAG: alpha/beta hydrolase [Planctomycetota bacterium]|jgi:enterochelin esterase-like enzyme
MITITNKTHKTKSTMFIRKSMTKSAFVMLCLFMIGLNATAQEGQIIRETVHSPSLEGNLLGDSPNRWVTIYLPPSYDTKPGRCYPVVYLLHGFMGNHNSWSILNTMKSWLEQDRVEEMILVMPNSNNRFRGSFYTNSSATGNWADYIAKDLVEYIDSYYRTLPQRESRAVIGHSMGGYGGVKIGILYPEIFGCMGGLAGAYMIVELEVQANASSYAYASTVEDWNQFFSLGWLQQTRFAFAAALAPNPDRPPFYCDFPYVYTDTIPREIVKVQEVYDKFLEHDILRLADKHRDALLSMKAIYIDCGTSDDLIGRSRQLNDKLEGLGVEHFYKEFVGGHTSRIMASTGDALEHFSSAMTFEMLAGELPTNLVPADGSMYPDSWVNLSWMGGQTAVSHDVYFGDNFDDVNNSTGGTFRGNQTETSFTVGLAECPYPDGLALHTTYYWRIDEVNDLDPNSPYKGYVWSFKVFDPSLVGYWKLDETWMRQRTK